MVQKLNGMLSIPHGFPQIPAPRKDCKSIQFPPNKRNDQYVMCPEQECECLVYFADQSRSMIDVLGLGQEPFWDDRVKAFYGWYSKSGSKRSQDAWTWEGKDNQKWSTSRGASKRNQSVPANPADRTDPNEKGLRWRDIGDLNKDESYLYPGKETDPACPVSKLAFLRKDDQQLCMQWIETILDLDRRTSKDPRLYCAYCDTNNHPRFASMLTNIKKRTRSIDAHCAVPSILHFVVQELKSMEEAESQIGLESNTSAQSRNLGSLTFDGEQMQLNFQLIFQHSVLISLKVQVKINSQCVQLQALTAMLHGIPMGASSSWQGGCPPIHEHREWAPPVAQNDVILPNPGYRVEANIWHLDIRESALRPGPIASFLRHCNTMESPRIPSYLHGGHQPADDIQNLSREASLENLVHLQRYAERLQFEATCVRLRSNGIQDQIMEETQQVQTWISRMIGELNRLHRVQPAWMQQLQAKASLQQPQPSIAPAPAPAPSQAPAQSASSSSAPGIPVKAAPASKNPSMSSAPRNAPFPNTQGADPWAAHKPRTQ